METSECSSVPYSLSDIQLPDSPGQVLKCKEIKKDENKVDSPSKMASDKSPSLDNNAHSNGNAGPDTLNSSHEEVMSEPEIKESKCTNDSPEKSNQRNYSRDSRHSDESSDVESDRNDSQYKKKSFSYEDISSNVAADSDDSPKEKVSKRQKSQQETDESDLDKSSDSEKYNHHLDSKHKSHDKHRKRNRHSRSRSRSSSTSSSRSSDSSPKHRHSKISVVSKAEDFNENEEKNQISDKNLDEKSKGIKKDNSTINPNLVSSVSSKKRLKIKRDNVPVEITSGNAESSRNATSTKNIEKNSSHSIPDIPSKQETTDVKEVIPEVPYTCRKVNLSNRRLNRKSSEDKSSEPKLKKSKWESFAACQKSSSTISISTDSLKNWFPDFKLLSEAPSSMEIETDEQSSSAVDEKTISIIHTDVSDTNDTGIRRESTSRIDVEDSESLEPNYEDASEQGPVSKIIFVQNLVRPFTLNQLKELLKQSGKIVEEYFWIDKIKSKCFVMYETEKEAIRARNALNNTRWPSSNPKILSVEFSNEEELEQHKKGNEPPPPKPMVEPSSVEMPENIIETRISHPVEEHKRKERERRKDRDRSKHQAPVREWDKDKVMQDSPEKEHIPKDEKSRSSEKKEKKESKKRPSEDTPAKLLDDLFQKTKNPPCIYWLPLTEEQAKEKEEAKKLRKLEREKRNQQLKEQEAERRSRRARSNRRSREKENRKSSTRSRSPVSRRR